MPHRQLPSPDACHRAVDTRDPHFDGLFYVAIVTTRIYCRPVCPSRRALPVNRHFFADGASAERAGFRPCLRCRPERSPGRATVDALAVLARMAAARIADGALDGGSVAALSDELGVTDRHLRRALTRILGATPVALAQTHRLRRAERLLAETDLSLTRVAFESGFQSLRRFNAAFRQRYEMTPGSLRAGVRNRQGQGAA